LKYLLAKNPQNQQFVADLEAKKSVDDDVLQEVGYQVEVVDGKVTVKKKD
jgi:ataxin-10